MSDDDEESVAYLLDVYMPRAKEFIGILRGLAFREFCSLKFFANGLRLVVDDEIEVQANAYFKVEFFTEYNIRAPEVSIYIKTKILLQSMNMFQEPAYAARFIYKTIGDPLEIRLESSTMDAQINVPTHPIVDILNINCDSSSLPVKILFSPSFLRELFFDLDPSCQTVKFEFFSDRLRFETKGEIYQLTEVEVCDENTDDFLVINSVDGGVIVCFRVEHLRKMIAILRIAKRAALRVDSNGVLCVHLMVEHDEDMITFIEFLFYRSVMSFDESTAYATSESAPTHEPASSRSNQNSERLGSLRQESVSQASTNR